MNYKPRIRKTCRRIFSRAFRFLDQPGEPGHKLQHFSFLLDRFNGCFYLHATIRLVRRWKHHQIWRLAKSLFERKVIVPNACSAEKPTLKKMKSFKLCPKLCFEYPLYVKLVIYMCTQKHHSFLGNGGFPNHGGTRSSMWFSDPWIFHHKLG